MNSPAPARQCADRQAMGAVFLLVGMGGELTNLKNFFGFGVLKKSGAALLAVAARVLVLVKIQ
jgi:hypothetical protein